MKEGRDRPVTETELIAPQRGESDIVREEVTQAMIMAGIVALGEWEEKRDYGREVTKTDLVCAIFAAMRLTSARGRR